METVLVLVAEIVQFFTSFAAWSLEKHSLRLIMSHSPAAKMEKRGKLLNDAAICHRIYVSFMTLPGCACHSKARLCSSFRNELELFFCRAHG
jgi:hypothetical protein